MKKIFSSLAIGAAMLIMGATPTFAITPNWDVTETYGINVNYLSVNYPETLVLVQTGGNITGSTLNTNPYAAGSAFTVTGGTVVGNAIEILAKQNTTALVVDLTGTIDTNGSMSGTWVDISPGTRTGTWATTSGNATLIPVLVGPPITMDQCKKDGWKTFNNPVFKNQCNCVSYVVNGKALSTFTASDSLYYNGPTNSAPLYATGPFAFTWNPLTGVVTGGYYDEQSPPSTGPIYHNLVTGGTVSGGTVHLNFYRSADNYSFTSDGTLSGNTYIGTLAGPYYFIAVGN